MFFAIILQSHTFYSDVDVEADVMPITRLEDGTGESIRVLDVDGYPVPTFDLVSPIALTYTHSKIA